MDDLKEKDVLSVIRFLVREDNRRKSLFYFKIIRIILLCLIFIMILICANGHISTAFILFVFILIPVHFLLLYIKRIIIINYDKLNDKKDIEIVDDCIIKKIDGLPYKIPIKKLLELTETEYKNLCDIDDESIARQEKYFNVRSVIEREAGRIFLLK